MAKALAQTQQTELHEAMQSLTPMVVEFLTGKFDELLGALCLSEVPDSLLMWSHYGASHTGFVLEFQSSHPYFHEQRSSDDEFRRLRRVFYRESRPSSHLTEMSAAELFLVKSGHWAYEREWRIIRALSDADTVLPGKPYAAHLFSFPPQALKGVIIGARATQDTTRAIREVITLSPELEHIRIRRAIPDSSHFHLRIVEDAISVE